MSNYLVKINQSEVKQDKNDRNYKTVTFSEVVMMKTPFGDVLKPSSQTRTRSVNCYEKSYLNEKEQPGYSDSIFDPRNPAKGGLFQGEIVSAMVEPYDIVDTRTGEVKVVDKYTTLVFGDSDSPAFKAEIRAAFKSQGHVMVESADPIMILAKEETVEANEIF